MPPRLQWAILFAAIAALAAWFIYKGGNGPCFGNITFACTHSSGSRPVSICVVIEPEVHDVAVLHHIFLAFQPEFAGLARAGFAVAGDIIGIGDGFGADIALLEIGVDDAGRLRAL